MTQQWEAIEMHIIVSAAFAALLLVTTLPTLADEFEWAPPWTIEELDACFVVKDSNGQKLGYFYIEEELGRRSAAKLVTKDEARRIAINFA
jgi:hypothetical protein